MPEPGTMSLDVAGGVQPVISCCNRKQLQVSPVLVTMKQEKARVAESGIVDGIEVRRSMTFLPGML
jgi:hypothetical protein